MDSSLLTPAIPYILGAGFLALASALVRWGYKVDVALSTQAAVNERFLGMLNVQATKLEAVKELTEEQLEDIERRLALAEGPVASNSGERHARKRR